MSTRARNRKSLPAIGLVEDNTSLREYFAEVVLESPGVTLSWTAAGYETARARLSQPCDLVLLDIGLPDGSGLDLIPLAKANGARVLVVTALGDRETVVSAIQAGADGYLLKDSDPDDIRGAIETTLAGGAPISAGAAVFLLQQLRDNPENADKSADVSEELSAREIDLLRAFATGQTYKEAARTLGISHLTVGTHVKSIYRKLAVHTRTEAVFAAVRSGKVRL